MTLCDRCINYPCSNNDIKLLKYCPAFNPKEKPITNADRIRAMTNAELARFFDNIETKNYFGEYLGELGWLEWLQQGV